jgi:hypothetical protein
MQAPGFSEFQSGNHQALTAYSGHALAAEEVEMNLSQALMAAEAQIDAKAAIGLPLEPSEAEQLCRFLRECAVEAMELEAVVHQPFLAGAGPDAVSMA